MQHNEEKKPHRSAGERLLERYCRTPLLTSLTLTAITTLSLLIGCLIRSGPVTHRLLTLAWFVPVMFALYLVVVFALWRIIKALGEAGVFILMLIFTFFGALFHRFLFPR